MTRIVPGREDALRFFRERFLNRTDRIAILAPWGKPQPVIGNTALDDLLLAHLFGPEVPEAMIQWASKKGIGVTKGRFRVGSYSPAPDGTTRWLCIDFDGPGHANALQDPQGAALAAWQAFASAGLPAYLERSGGGNGWHLWAFFDPPIAADKAQALGRALAPKGLLLDDGGKADPKANRGIEVFPKQTSMRGKGFGNLVWLPWWRGAPEGANSFYQPGATGELVPFVPNELIAIPPDAVERVLSIVAAAAKPARNASVSRPTARLSPSSNQPDPVWADWRRKALAALPLEAVYGRLLTGKPHGHGWLECHDPGSPSGDQDPSASVADGQGDAERAAFHSFITGNTVSVFDFLMRVGEAASFREAAARVGKLSGVPLPEPRSPAGSGAGEKGPARPTIELRRQLRDMVDDAWDAIHARNEPQKLFMRSSCLVQITRDENGSRIETLDEAAVLDLLGQVADWVKVGQDQVRDEFPPHDVVRVVHRLPRGLPVLQALLTAPTFTKSGRLLRENGYHQDAYAWMELPPELQVPPVSEAPATEELAAARALLSDELLGDFPFVEPADRAHMLAMLLLPFARRLVPGLTPIHLVEAPEAGSGKGLLVALVGLLCAGTASSGGSIPDNDEEVRKKITSELASGHPLLVLDNADEKKKLDSPALASALTMPVWKDRVLGQTRMISLPNQVVWILTGNNPRLSTELARRCIRIRINPRVDRPWLRSGFKHPALLDWAHDNRSALVHAALTLIQNWIAQGRPPGGIRLGSFEQWSEVLGGILSAASVPGFLGNLESLYETADTEGGMWREFILVWWSKYQDAGVRVADLAQLCATANLLEPVLGEGSEKSQHIRLGRALQRVRDRVFGEHRLEAVPDPHTKRPVYRLAKVTPEGAP